jgi:hypothetical protein
VVSANDPYKSSQRPLEKLHAKLRRDGKLRPAADCVVEIKTFIDTWDKTLGELDDAVAVFARRQNVSFQPRKMIKALVNALVVGASGRHDRLSTEWAIVLTALREVPYNRAREAIIDEGGVDKIAKSMFVSAYYDATRSE